MKSIIAGVIFTSLAATVFAADTNHLAIIPWPQQVTLQSGAFKLTPDTRVYADSASRGTATFLTGRLRPSTGYPCKMPPGMPARIWARKVMNSSSHRIQS